MTKLIAKLAFIFVIVIGCTSSAELNYRYSKDDRLEFYATKAVRDELKLDCAKITLELKNITGDTLTFVSSDCGWGLFSLDGDSIKDHTVRCKSLLPAFRKVAPYGKLQFYLYAKTTHLDRSFSPFRVGINLAEPKEKMDLFKAFREEDKIKNTLWTDPIVLK